MARVNRLLPGDKVSQGGRSAVFITACPHPVWEGLRLVIWRMDDDSLSLDALRGDQDVGQVEPIEPAARATRLRDALLAADQVAGHGTGQGDPL
jgi:hypothetical protein